MKEGIENDGEDRGAEKGKGGEVEVVEGRDLGVTFLKCNRPGAALLPSVNTGPRGGLTAGLSR